MKINTKSLPRETGEITIALTVLSLAIMVFGVLIGGKGVLLPKTLTNKASESCEYHAVNQIKDSRTGFILASQPGFSWRNNFTWGYGSYPSSGPDGLTIPWNTNLANGDPKNAEIYDLIKKSNPDPAKQATKVFVELAVPQTYQIVGTFCDGNGCPSGIGPGNARINDIAIFCGGNVIYGWRVSLKPTMEPTPTLRITQPFQPIPTRLPTTTLPSQAVPIYRQSSTPLPSPTIAPPCFVRSKLTVKDEQGAAISLNTLRNPDMWYTTSSRAPTTKGLFTHFGETAPLNWQGNNIYPNMGTPNTLTQSLFLKSLPTATKGLVDITLHTEPQYEVTQRKVNTHCMREFDTLNSRLIGCSDVNDKGQPTGTHTGIIYTGDTNTITGLSIQCNMDIDAEWTVRKKPVETGDLHVQVQLSAGGDMSKNIPFITNRIRDTNASNLIPVPATLRSKDANPYYEGRSTVTIEGDNQNGEHFKITNTIIAESQTLAGIPVGKHTISYNFPGYVLAKSDAAVYALNADTAKKSIDGDKVNIQKDNAYTYRVLYNIRNSPCKSVRNTDSCRSCGGEPTDSITNPAWSNPNGKVMCCPVSGKAFTCSADFDNRCAPDSIYYGNCGHKFGSNDTDYCPQDKRAKFVCNGNTRTYQYIGCVESPATMDRCFVPSPTPIPRPTRSTQQSPQSYLGGTLTIINPQNIPLNEGNISISWEPGEYIGYPASKTLTNLRNGANKFRISLDDEGQPILPNTKYKILTAMFSRTTTKSQRDEHLLNTIVTAPYDQLSFTLDLSNVSVNEIASVTLDNPSRDLASIYLIIKGFDSKHIEIIDMDPSKPGVQLELVNKGYKGTFDTYQNDYDPEKQEIRYLAFISGENEKKGIGNGTLFNINYNIKNYKEDNSPPNFVFDYVSLDSNTNSSDKDNVEYPYYNEPNTLHISTSVEFPSVFEPCTSVKGSGSLGVVFIPKNYAGTDYQSYFDDVDKAVNDFYKNDLSQNVKNKLRFQRVNTSQSIAEAKKTCAAQYAVFMENSNSGTSSCSTLGGPATVKRFQINDSTMTLSHELGHCIAGLSDEYPDPQGRNANGKSPANCTTDKTCTDWRKKYGSKITCDKVCYFLDLYRPENESIMTSHDTQHFNGPSKDAWENALQGFVPEKLFAYSLNNIAYHSVLDLDFKDEGKDNLQITNVKLDGGYPQDYKFNLQHDYYKVVIKDNANKDLFSGKIGTLATEHVTDWSTKPVTSTDTSAPITDFSLSLPYYKNASKVQILDEKGYMKLDVNLADYHLSPPVAPKSQNLCGNSICDSVIGESINSCQKDCKATAQSFVTTDLNGDKVTNALDYAILLNNYGRRGNLKEDIDQDGSVNAPDMSKMIEELGQKSE